MYSLNKTRQLVTVDLMGFHVPYTVTRESVTEPITVAQAKSNMRVEHGRDDVDIARHITTARDRVEQSKMKSLVPTTVTKYMDCLPAGRQPIWLGWGPIASITSVTYLDADGNSTVMDSEDYHLDAPTFRLVPAFGNCWPTSSYLEGSVHVVYETGTQSVSPEDLDLIYLITEKLYLESTDVDLQRAIDQRMLSGNYSHLRYLD